MLACNYRLTTSSGSCIPLCSADQHVSRAEADAAAQTSAVFLLPSPPARQTAILFIFLRRGPVCACLCIRNWCIALLLSPSLVLVSVCHHAVTSSTLHAYMRVCIDLSVYSLEPESYLSPVRTSACYLAHEWTDEQAMRGSLDMVSIVTAVNGQSA